MRPASDQQLGFPFRTSCFFGSGSVSIHLFVLRAIVLRAIVLCFTPCASSPVFHRCIIGHAYSQGFDSSARLALMPCPRRRRRRARDPPA